MREANRLKLLGVLLAWATALAACCAFAQPSVTRGGALKKRQYQTYSDLTFYLDPTGNDANPCTASGTQACLTAQGVINKLPRFVRHNVTVNVAAGSYAGTVRWANTTFAGETATPIITWDGPALIDATLGSGTATGTLSSVSISLVPLPTVTDSTQTWTPDALKGLVFYVTSGTGAGQAVTIVSNTATTITTMPWLSTSPAAGSGYAIRTQAATFTGAWVLTGLSGAATFAMQKLAWSVASGTAFTYAQSPTASGVRLPASSFRSASGTGASFTNVSWPGSGIVNLGGGNTTIGFYAQGSTAGIAFVRITNSAPQSSGQFVGVGGSVGIYVLDSVLYDGNLLGAHAETTTGNGTAFRADSLGVANTALIQNSVLSLKCPSGSTGYGLALIEGYSVNRAVVAENCGTGVFVGSTFSTPSRARFEVTAAGMVCTNTTTCVSVNQGGRFLMRASFNNTGVTNEVLVDGSPYTLSLLNSLTPRVITGNAGSVFENY